MAFPRFKLWGLPLWGGKEETENFTNMCSSNSSPNNGFGVREIESVKFPVRGTKMNSSSSRKIKKKWHSREERKIEREHDVVIVPKDGVCLSGSESEDSDWSIGWLEPHGPDFLSDDETDDSFAVLVPCYRNDRRGPTEGPNSNIQLLNTIKNFTSEPYTEGKNMMDQWLSSLQNF
ncbi:uncharacterized protein LOC104895509 [Beta vulgaris subsp. vulgaris]|uniref:uncharacterized protein LOC104895509 n=1 Tax=Beta vulgaris subsp. vulgaris TaxID=3555 RepID=UPI00053FBF93|nr:uncharacterized protein LOC104895509 [Beta vulgaris subsp. vulgaris]